MGEYVKTSAILLQSFLKEISQNIMMVFQFSICITDYKKML